MSCLSGGSVQVLSRISPIFLLLVVMPIPVFGREKAPVQEGDYLGSPAGARPVSLGGALAGVAGDQSALFWNPAGLSLLPVNLISITFRRRGVSSISISTPEMALGWHSLSRIDFEDSLSLQVDDEETTEVRKDMEFWLDEYIVSITTMAHNQSLRSEENIFVGTNLKYVRGGLGIAEKRNRSGSWQDVEVNLDRGNGYGVDVGILVRQERFGLGLAVQNLLAKVYWHDYENERIRANLMGGFSILPWDWLTLAGALEQRWNRRTSTILRLGGEAVFWRERSPRWYGIFTSFSPSIRLGMYGPNLSETEGRVLTGGFGYVYSRYQVDIAAYGADVDNLSYVVTLSVPF